MFLNDFYKELDNKIFFEEIKTNSSKVNQGDIFIAIKGSKNDGHNYINEAIDKGAIFIICETKINVSVPYKIVRNTKIELINILNFYYNHDQIKLIGTTGTDGKTTTATILYHILNYNNDSSYIGTNGFYYKKQVLKLENTTPSASFLYTKLQKIAKLGIKTCSLEVSSEGILDHRVDGLKFDGAIFTNLTHEHLNSHKTMRNYFKAKQKLFSNLNYDNIAIINADDKYGKKIKTKAKIVTFGLKKGMYRAKNIHLFSNKTIYDLYYKNLFLTNIELPLFGIYNIYNSLGAIAYAYERKTPISIIKNQLKTLIKIEGRFDVYEQDSKTFIIDFAHTPNALENLLSNLLYIRKKNIVLVMGCAGEKDTSKRKEMSKIACKLANVVIFTSEDPKNENLMAIFHDMTCSLKRDNYYMCIDRKEAIKLACKISNKDDIVVITGKGNEKYEVIKDVKFRHSDLEEIKKSLNGL